MQSEDFIIDDNGKMKKQRVVLITGAMGFIGSNLVKFWLDFHPDDRLILLDGYTYAARPKYVKDFIKNYVGDYTEEIVDIRDQVAVARVMAKHKPDLVFHLAAESHVSRSIAGPQVFMETNVIGTFNMVEEFYQVHKEKGFEGKKFVHISTDEVFGELEIEDPPFTERHLVAPRSPYASSKASSDLIALSFYHTYGVPVVVTNCSNNFGPNQHEEKLIPAVIKSLLEEKPVVVHGTGLHMRDWLYVEDHCRALNVVSEKGVSGERYCIGGEDEKTNLLVIAEVRSTLSSILKKRIDAELDFRNDRPTDDKRYAIDCSKLRELGWKPSKQFEANLTRTIQYYVEEWRGAGNGTGVERGVLNV